MKVLYAFVAVVFLLQGCATVVQAEKSESEAVAERAKARWDTLIAGDLDRAYQFLSPGARALMSLDQYKGRIKAGLWRSARVDGVECGEGVCKVTVKVEFDYRLSGTNVGGESPLKENWIKESGLWYFVPRR